MAPKNNIHVIRNGTYFGECLLYCNEEITLASNQVVYTLTSPRPDSMHPDIRAESPMEAGLWQTLLELLDWSALRSMPRTIGAPDASDAGGEFLEVSGDQGNIRVDVEKDAAVPKVAALLTSLRDLRSRLALKHRPAT
jgi:hypothetical protein